MKQWQVQTAKAQFSKVLALANCEGPQIISRHGTEIAAVVPISMLRPKFDDANSLVDFFALAPRIEIDTARSKDPGRKVAW